ncbi:glycosyltransferase family 2 protein [Actinophytocola algeriensis]|uniref:Glycosyltransferase involved in cell wall biosynthesis n=1 Tax=Actinophytocola algeriensis TaxID=1768010 RepID=A0A7W7VFM8_9PSEU|nr:glycosyltransferase [Actinophytocola algeriensis]MBB4908517.1 glycosyltransferase involved in cell wall biosynthesis [Actinophytocola algeriensis]MBE1475096.1 glycosyltransferase involved in cell wall biosynthesis [Actinophytocola algeriensis]
MPLVSIITPTQAHNADFIGELWLSLEGQALPPGWEFEWLVQEDGVAPAVLDRLPDDPRVRYEALGVQIGGAATRNTAVARAAGDLVAGMDHDDFYEPGGLAALVSPFASPEVAWSCARMRWMNPDGATWVKPDVFPAGLVPTGVIAETFVRTDDFPFPASIVTYRRQHLLAHGGWPAVARSTDAVLLAAFSSRWAGVWVAQVAATYRRWPRQHTVQSADIAIRDVPHVRGAIAQRLAAERALAASGDG